MPCYQLFLISQCYCSAISSASYRVFWKGKIASHSNIVEKCSIQSVCNGMLTEKVTEPESAWYWSKNNKCKIIISIRNAWLFVFPVSRSLDSNVCFNCTWLRYVSRQRLGYLPFSYRRWHQQFHLFGLSGEFVNTYNIFVIMATKRAFFFSSCNSWQCCCLLFPWVSIYDLTLEIQIVCLLELVLHLVFKTLPMDSFHDKKTHTHAIICHFFSFFFCSLG